MSYGVFRPYFIVQLYNPPQLVYSKVAGTTDGVLSVTCTSTVSFVGASKASSNLSWDGTISPTQVLLIGASFSSAPLSISSTGSFNGIGASLSSSTLSVTSTGVATFIGAATNSGVLSCTGNGTFNGVGAALSSNPLSISCTSTVSFIGGALATEGILNSVGSCTVTFVGKVTSSSPLSITCSGIALFTGSTLLDLENYFREYLNDRTLVVSGGPAVNEAAHIEDANTIYLRRFLVDV